MKLFQREQRSLFGEILDWMLTPLLLLWPVSLALTWLVAQNIAGKPFDRALEFNVQALAQLVVVQNQHVVFNLPQPAREIPTWQGVDTLVSREVTIVGPDGEKVDVMTFRGGYERDIREFVERTPELKAAVDAEDDDEVETIVNERFYHRPTMVYSPDKLVISYGVPASTPAFVYNAVGRKPLPTRDAIVSDTVDSIAARFNLRYNEQKWLDATAQLIAEDSTSLKRFMDGDMTIFNASQFNRLGGIAALSRFEQRENVFEALRQSSLIRQSLLTT